MYVSHAGMSMIRRLAIRIMELSRVQLLRIFRKTGYARYAEWEKKYLYRKIKVSENKETIAEWSNSAIVFLSLSSFHLLSHESFDLFNGFGDSSG